MWQENLVGQYIYICLHLQNVIKHTDIFRTRGADFSNKFYSNLLDKREIKLIKLSQRIIDIGGSIIFKNHIFTILKWYTYKVALKILRINYCLAIATNIKFLKFKSETTFFLKHVIMEIKISVVLC